LAKAKAEEPKEKLNREWTLCITLLDLSEVPRSLRPSGEAAARILANRIKAVDRRFRGEEEREYYRLYAISKIQTENGKAVAAKRAERDALIFRGDPAWKYQKSLKTLEADIAKLEEKARSPETDFPGIESTPVFRLTEGNVQGIYPDPPKPGGEYAFCLSQKADGLLTGRMSEFYGRIYLTVKIYARYAGAYIYEDSTVFSIENMEQVLGEFSSRLSGAISESGGAIIAVHASPEDTMVLIDGIYAGRGEVIDREEVPGPTEVTLYAQDHAPYTGTIDLQPGERTDLYIDLTPFTFSSFTVDVPGKPGSSVYQGSLYLGQTPLTLRLPQNQFTYLSVETPEGETGSSILQGNRTYLGGAQFIQADAPEGKETVLSFKTSLPPPVGETPVEEARRKFYGAYGRFWIVLPLTIFTLGLSRSYIEGVNNTPADQRTGDQETKAKVAYYAQGAAWGLLGLSLAEVFYRIFRYVRASSPEADPLAR